MKPVTLDTNAVGSATPEISVVVPLYNEAENVAELYRRLRTCLDPLWFSFELVLVDDGSADQTPELLDSLQRRDERVVVLHLSRNFGHQAAVCAGIDAARGQAVIVMDGDLQDPPEVFEQLVARWREGFEVVYAVRQKRKENLFKRTAYFLFYRLLRAVSDLDIPLDSGDFCLMDRRVVDVLKHLPERMRFVRGLRTFVGFRQCGVRYERAAREAGDSKYSFAALVRLAMDGLIGFSSFPVTMIAILGILSAGLAMVFTLWFVVGAGLTGTSPPGWAVAAAVVLLMGSFQLMGQGILGAYIRRIFIECKGRPTYIVRDQLRRDVSDGNSLPVSRSRAA
jgi:dolichol-phosphate mannosyltransferase